MCEFNFFPFEYKNNTYITLCIYNESIWNHDCNQTKLTKPLSTSCQFQMLNSIELTLHMSLHVDVEIYEYQNQIYKK